MCDQCVSSHWSDQYFCPECDANCRRYTMQLTWVLIAVFLVIAILVVGLVLAVRKQWITIPLLQQQQQEQ